MGAGRPATAILTMPYLLRRLAPVALILLGACATIPTGPQVLALPGSNKTFDQFRADDAVCRQYALEQVSGVTPSQAATNAAVGSAVVGTAIGAAAGAAFGGGSGAAVGAGVGLLGGSAVGAGYGYGAGYTVQTRYDYGYLQCMYAKGNKVPVSRAYVQSREQVAYPSPGPGLPPPPNAPPPGAVR
jgi:outer membrane lipoprotein SlyB